MSAGHSARWTLRAMRADDVAAVLDLERRLFPHDAWPESFFYDELAHAEPTVPADQATRRYWVAETAEQAGGTAGIIGYAGMMCVLPLADVQTIAVAPEAQGQGLGSALLEEIETEARRRGAEDLLLEVREDNPGAQRLYLRVGFEQIHRRPHYYPDGGDALIMRKHLADPKPSTAANLTGDVR
ncbi:ribosomal protein S18-alanine N-acetyltransferase [Nesterenkonia flava]|uniref:Ribosomal protein S18-alanine N-acetyltransferase n=1 Tax=Nesterenkonia flava TaxID=469799 RepID=A0ABU1FRY1_9MICC|nr:ribosomal protein S18-alanine N-acetyltransferase [Nesterenkonia flava]MDR5710906.1 ribosomal protein S18-alanine N-acetyltransferase [Nesterenkonia flava]